MKVDNDWWARVSDPCPVPVGTRIRLLDMPDDPNPIEPGTTGTVRGGNGSQLWVNWDNGRSLNLSLPHDRYEVIVEDEAAEDAPDDLCGLCGFRRAAPGHTACSGCA